MKEFPAGLLPGPFTVEQARAAGVSPAMLRGRRVRAVLPGVYASREVAQDLLIRCRAAGLAIPPPAAISHDTAAWLHRLPMPHAWRDAMVHISVPATATRPRALGLCGHRATWADGDLVRQSGLTLTSLERTWCDLGSSWTRFDLIACADAILRRTGPRGKDRLAARVDCWAGRRGARDLRAALDRSSLRVDSPMETRLRLLLLDAGLPPPLVNIPVRESDGAPVHTPDLSWPARRLAVDYDGIHHLQVDADRDVLAGRRDNWRRRQDLTRHEMLREVGWTLIVVTAYDLLNQPDRLVARVRAALAQ